MPVLGTAGHVDHGKTSFLRYLTQMEPSRLAVEKKRGMTIQLGYVWYQTESGEKIGIVDVPGHEDYRATMIMGASGIDAFLFIVAADDGWMMQSEEHLWTIKTLGLKHGIAVLTKMDLVDKERLNEVQSEVEVRIFDALGIEIPVLPFSAATGDGGEEIKRKINELLLTMPEDKDIGPPYLFLDRVFAVQGQGTVVTGTLKDGSLKLKEKVEILPISKKVLIRGIQCYGQQVDVAKPVTRVALQVSDLTKEEIEKGSQLGLGGQVKTTEHVDLKVIPYQGVKLEKASSRRVLLIHGGVRSEGSLVHIGQTKNMEHIVRVHLEIPRWLRFADHVLVLSSGADKVMAGGRVVDEMPLKGILKAKENLAQVDEFSLDNYLSLQLNKRPWLMISDLIGGTSFDLKDINDLAKNFQSKIHAEKDWVCRLDQYNNWLKDIENIVRNFHRQYPELEGIAASKICQIMKVPENVLSSLLQVLKDRKTIQQQGPYLKIPNHVPVFGKLAPDIVKKLEEIHQCTEIKVFSLVEMGLTSAKDKIVIGRFVEEGKIIRLDEKNIMSHPVYRKVTEKIVGFLKTKGSATSAEIRDHLNVGRKIVILVLESMDNKKITVFENNVRKLR